MCKEYQINELIESHMDLVPFVITKYFSFPNKHVREEMLSVGYEELVRAARKYDPERAQFSTFAIMKIRFAIMRYFRNEYRQAERFPGFSMDKPAGEDGNEWHELLADESASYEDSILTEMMAREALSFLQGEELEIIMAFYGIDADQPAPLHAIGRRIGWSASKTWHLKEEALVKLRKAVHVG